MEEVGDQYIWWGRRVDDFTLHVLELFDKMEEVVHLIILHKLIFLNFKM